MDDRWDRKLVAFEMLKMWSTNSMLTMKETAWLALRDESSPVYFNELRPEQKVACNAVINFFNRLRVLTGGQSSNLRMADTDLVDALFSGDTGFWSDQLDKLHAKPNNSADVELLKWYKEKIRPFMVDVAHKAP